ncbi:hypothetical protein CEXT_7151 [Caerostris extrusa]|uniref:Secreted protein n=1 Tax=Caerostris extrusa TaxID=172846 RepID=A0AAV4MY66_CAEEX|nr:hypothetical protein CEXT_7151 [Caerostris extrusa]
MLVGISLCRIVTVIQTEAGSSMSGRDSAQSLYLGVFMVHLFRVGVCKTLQFSINCNRNGELNLLIGALPVACRAASPLVRRCSYWA